MVLVLSAVFVFNTICTAVMIHTVFPHMRDMQAKGILKGKVVTYALIALGFEGAIALLSFVVLFDGADKVLIGSDADTAVAVDITKILLGMYALATAFINIWIVSFHRSRWK